MTARKMGAALTAIFLGTAAIGAISVTLAMPAQAAVVTREFSVPITEAKALAAAGNYKGAMAKVEAAAAIAKGPEENKIVSQMKDYIASKSGDPSTPIGAQAKFAQDFDAQKWKEVIADGNILKKFDKLDDRSQLVVAQAYFRQHDNTGCISYIKKMGSSAGEDALQTLQRCAFDAHDDATQRDALEQLVARTGKPNYWSDLLKISQNAKGITDHETLDIYRLKLLTGAINNDPAKARDEYTTLSKLALQFKLAAESQSVLEKGIAAKALDPAQTARLLTMAKGTAAANAEGEVKALAGAKGDDRVQIGEDQIGQGKPKDAITTIKSGIDTGAKDAANAQMRLGVAYLAAGQKADALKTFNAVKGDDNQMMVAHLYALYAKH